MQTKKQMTVAMIAMLGVIALDSNVAAQQKFQKLSGARKFKQDSPAWN